MDILKKLIANPGLQHVADIVIGHLDKDFWTNLAEDREYRELFTEGEQEFLMKTKAAKTLRKSMYDEAKKICEEKREFADYKTYLREAYCYLDPYYGRDYRWHNMSIFDMFPFYAEALEELKSSESLLSFEQLQKTVSLLKNVVTENNPGYDDDGFKLSCLHRCIPDETLVHLFHDETDEQDVKKGPEDMIKTLEEGDARYYLEIKEFW